MIIGSRRASFLLFIGDLVAFVVSLYATLWLRYGGDFPSVVTFKIYWIPFTLIFALWALIFYGAGLYSKRSILLTSRLPDLLIKTQIANIILAALVFFIIPKFRIAPKTILALYLLTSLVFILFWRLVLYPRISVRRTRERAILAAEGPEAEELRREVNDNARYGIEFRVNSPDTEQASLVVVDKANSRGLSAKDLARRREQHVIAFEDMYEEVFDRIPLSQLKHEWFLKHVSSTDPLFYMITKRFIDIIGALCMAIVTTIIAPLIAIANLCEGSGPLFIIQERFGRFGVPITAYKFRSMQKNLAASEQWVQEGKNPVTKVGAFLRLTSLDEFPQFINILRGELSLVGPRNDILGLGRRLAEALPYYEARYMVIPGITGWAQINQQYEPGNVSPQSIKETKMRLAYDFYYRKHRSLRLDIIIALKTFKRMFFRLSSW